MSLLGNRGRFSSDKKNYIFGSDLASELSSVGVNPYALFDAKKDEGSADVSLADRINKPDIKKNIEKVNSLHHQYNEKLHSVDKKKDHIYKSLSTENSGKHLFDVFKVGKKTLVAMVIVELMSLVAVFGVATFVRLTQMTQIVPFDPKIVVSPYIAEDTIEIMKGYKTVAVFGVDSRNGSVAQGNNADVNLIVNLNIENGEVQLVSIFRDLYLNVTNNNIYDKINSAYRRGGPESVVSALNKNFDLNIVNFFAFNWKAVAMGIQLIDGIDLEISKSEFKYINAFIHETCIATGIDDKNPALHYIKSPGFQHLDGVQAVAYGRLRLMDSDFQRVERQKKVVMLCLQKAKNLDLPTLRLIMESVLPQIAYEFDMNEMISLLRIVRNVNIVDSISCPDPANVIAMDMGPCGTCVVPLDLEKSVIELHKVLFSNDNYKVSSAVKRYSNRITELRRQYKEENDRRARLATGSNIGNEDEATRTATRSNASTSSKRKVSSPSNTNKSVSQNNNLNNESGSALESEESASNSANNSLDSINSNNEAVVVEGPPGSYENGTNNIAPTEQINQIPLSPQPLQAPQAPQSVGSSRNGVVVTPGADSGPITRDAPMVEPSIVIP